MNRTFSNTLKEERQCKQREQNNQREVKQLHILEEQQKLLYGWNVRGTGDKIGMLQRASSSRALGILLKRNDGPQPSIPILLALVFFLSKKAHCNRTLSQAFDLRVPLLALTVRHFCPTDYNSLWAIIQLPSPGPAAVSPNIISFMHILSVSLLSGIISELNFSPAILASGAARFMG